MPQSLANNTIHLVFSTNERKRLLNDELRPELHGYLATVFKNEKCPAIVINSMEDHIHILFVLHRTVALSKIVEEVKKSSSKWVKTKSPLLKTFSWQAGYGAFSVSQSNISAVKQYILNQEEHHRTMSFQDELRKFLTKHGMGYDERYLWD